MSKKSNGISQEIISNHGLSEEEYQSIIKYLGRKPNLTELGVFSVMWSEHCSYKSSRIHLKKFPTKAPHVVHGPGENAGVVDIGDGQVVAFKMESHNHPSFIEPYQGAATGVGGILRDVFTMGARPIALLNSLRFGIPNNAKTKYLVEGVVSGISGYGNSFGCPTVGGEVYFHPSYQMNPLVNAFCLGIADKDKIFLGRAEGIGNSIMYVGSKTGRDGIHGATMASQEFDDTAESKKPTVQVGDPFTEKLLLEACLEVMQKECLVGIQDMGAAGLTSSSVEMAGRAGNGVCLDLTKIPTREKSMTPYELLLSESQERMLLIVKKGYEHEVKEVFDKWDLDSEIVGEVTRDGRFKALFQGEEVVNIPVKALTESAPIYERPMEETKLEEDISLASIEKPNDLNEVLKRLISSPNLCSRKWIYRQYDHQVRTNSVVLPGGDAAIIRIKNSSKGIALTTDCNGHYCEIDPYQGAQMAVAEASRNLACVGATPLGLTDCLNFGNPEKPNIMWQFKQAVEGISSACEFLGIPVVSGNVSFYNETNGESIVPTPSIAMVGLLKDIEKRMTHGFKKMGDKIVLLGNIYDEGLGGSEYITSIHGIYKKGRLPKLHLFLEQKVQSVVLELISKNVIHSAHDCSEGGLAVAIAESCFENNIGANIQLDNREREDVLLFGEAPSRIIVSVSKENLKRLEEVAQKNHIPFKVIGETIEDKIIFNQSIDLSISTLKNLWENAFEQTIVG